MRDKRQQLTCFTDDQSAPGVLLRHGLHLSSPPFLPPSLSLFRNSVNRGAVQYFARSETHEDAASPSRASLKIWRGVQASRAQTRRQNRRRRRRRRRRRWRWTRKHLRTNLPSDESITGTLGCEGGTSELRRDIPRTMQRVPASRRRRPGGNPVSSGAGSRGCPGTFLADFQHFFSLLRRTQPAKMSARRRTSRYTTRDRMSRGRWRGTLSWRNRRDQTSMRVVEEIGVREWLPVRFAGAKNSLFLSILYFAYLGVTMFTDLLSATAFLLILKRSWLRRRCWEWRQGVSISLLTSLVEVEARGDDSQRVTWPRPCAPSWPEPRGRAFKVGHIQLEHRLRGSHQVAPRYGARGTRGVTEVVRFLKWGSPPWCYLSRQTFPKTWRVLGTLSLLLQYRTEITLGR